MPARTLVDQSQQDLVVAGHGIGASRTVGEREAPAALQVVPGTLRTPA